MDVRVRQRNRPLLVQRVDPARGRLRLRTHKLAQAGCDGWPRSYARAAMARERIDRDRTLAELGVEIDAAARRHVDDEPHLDRNLQPITDQELVDRVRWLERKTGQRLIFRDEPPPAT